jgi:ribosomal-protein-alanine N-acetyltransferase
VSELVARGERVGLRPLLPEDVGERYVAWMTDPEVTRFLESRFESHTQDSLRRYVEEIDGRADTLFFAIVELPGGRHVGNVKIGPIDPRHGTADLGILIGEKDCWGRGYAAEAIALATREAFARLGARKLTASCYGNNTGSARAFLRAGWQAEGTRPAQFVGVDGEPQDQMLLGILREDA